ncbi:NAD(P)-dependent alcohol dehydrogenase [Parapedobacter pyrenivorans]|uniref:NAD(P)-dependent alcohol dehydrogenase n=1 Tax=Parapedobacter pyrenivorans TaxID=1305674 RepID=UPI00333EEEC4
MKAAIYTRYGPPEVVSVTEVGTPQPTANEVLIKIYATTVNRTDCGFRSAEYFVSRFWSGLLRPKGKILGNEFAGEIAAIGMDVTGFSVGDRVFGYDDTRFGSHAEYKTIDANGPLATIPEGWTYEDAAPLTEGAHYALGNIKASKVTSGQYAMVYGATGAIGSAAVQLLTYFGVHVTAVCQTKNLGLVEKLGAQKVIDYLNEDFTKTDRRFDFIFDAVGKSSFGQCKPLLTTKGVYISTELGKNSENIFLALAGMFSTGKKVLFPIPKITKEDVLFLKDLAESGHFKPIIDRHYSLEQIVDAYRYVETGQKTGNVVITMTA